ncbi:hypothetical protein HY950_00050 [Candidatus Gottesmanbacteria bacterium]|nr:hypothetical protein [Candidatus Gottesmanbacteria bacterium]
MHKRYERLGQRFGRWVAVGMLAVLSAFALMVWTALKKPAFPRLTVVAVGDPVVVWSWDRSTNRAVRIAIPAATVIDAVGGYGKYSLEALWRLGGIEKRGGTILAQSLQEALGLPIDGYISPNRPETSVAADTSLVPKPLQISGLPFVMFDYRTNISFVTLIRLSLAANRLRPDSVTSINMTKDNALVEEQLPDGTVAQTPDAGRLDMLLGTMFEDARVRGEGLSVSVYNTTEMVSLGSRVGKLLGRIGVFVVRVGNDTSTVDQCSLRGGKKALASATAAVITGILGCGQEEGTPEVADLEVRVGTAYQARFLPTPQR